MATVNVERTIPAPIEAVFDVISDHAGYSRFPGIQSSELVREGEAEPNGLGALRRIRSRPLRFEEEITRFERPSRMDYLIVDVNAPIGMRGARWCSPRRGRAPASSGPRPSSTPSRSSAVRWARSPPPTLAWLPSGPRRGRAVGGGGRDAGRSREGRLVRQEKVELQKSKYSNTAAFGTLALEDGRVSFTLDPKIADGWEPSSPPGAGAGSRRHREAPASRSASTPASRSRSSTPPPRRSRSRSSRCSRR